MGAVYSVTFKFKLKDREGAYRELKSYMLNPNTRANFHIDEFKAEGVDVTTFEGLMRVVLAGWKCTQWSESVDGHGKTIFNNAFDASYGWESVMIEAFSAIAPYLADQSSLIIYPDNGVDHYVVREGKAVCLK